MAVTMGNEGRALLAQQQAAPAYVEARYRAAQAFEEPPHVTLPMDEAPEPMSREARIVLAIVVVLLFAAVAVIGLARLALRMGPA